MEDRNEVLLQKVLKCNIVEINKQADFNIPRLLIDATTGIMDSDYEEKMDIIENLISTPLYTPVSTPILTPISTPVSTPVSTQVKMKLHRELLEEFGVLMPTLDTICDIFDELPIDSPITQILPQSVLIDLKSKVDSIRDILNDKPLAQTIIISKKEIK